MSAAARLVDAARLCARHGAAACGCAEEAFETFVREGAMMDAAVQSLHVEGDQVDATLRPHPVVVRVLYASLVHMLGDATNYVETQVRTADGKRAVVTVVRDTGKTPHALRREAEEEAARWKARALAAEARLGETG